MYCPKCFNDTLKVHSRGVARLLFNGKQKDTSAFLFNLAKDDKKALRKKFKDKVEDFLSWYSSFQNKPPIKNFEIYSNDFACKNGCPLDVKTKISLIEILFTPEEVIEVLNEVGEKYDIKIDIKPGKNL